MPQLCIMQSNCQGEELERLLLASSAFTAAYRLQRYTNFTQDSIPAHELASCTAFLYQHLGEGWGDLSSANLTRQLSPTAKILQIPNMMCRAYWPFWESSGPIAFSDSFLNKLIEEGTPKPIILKLYLHSDITSFIDLAEQYRETFAKEEQKEENAHIRTVPFVQQHWKERPLFHTINHPGKELLVRTAQSVLAFLGLPELSASELAAVEDKNIFPAYSDFDLPIHPQVAAFHGLAFGDAEQPYTVYGRSMTFAQYTSRYIDCRLNGYEDDFVSYLHII